LYEEIIDWNNHGKKMSIIYLEHAARMRTDMEQLNRNLIS